MVRRVIIGVCAIYWYWSIPHGSRGSVLNCTLKSRCPMSQVIGFRAEENRDKLWKQIWFPMVPTEAGAFSLNFRWQ